MSIISIKEGKKSPFGRRKNTVKTIEEQVAKKLRYRLRKKSEEEKLGDMTVQCKQVREDLKIQLEIAEPFQLPMILPSREQRITNMRPAPNFNLDKRGNM